MNAMIKPRVGAKTDQAALEYVEVISVAIPVISPVAANSDWFEDMVPDLFDIPAYDNEPWVDETSGIDETWSRLEDIWLRLASHPGIACTTVSDPVQGDQLLMFCIQGRAINFEAAMLLEVAGSSRTYQWREEGSQGSLVSDVNWYGDKLVIDIPSFHQMRAWPGGDSLVCQMQALLRHLQSEPQH
jgi:hypothetical protein